MALFLDLKQEHHAHIDQRLRETMIAWLVSERVDNRPHAAPIGFYWDGESIWIFTRPQAQKIRNIGSNSQVLLVLDDTKNGVDPISIEGTATLLATTSVPRTLLAVYAEKYVEHFTAIGLNLEGLAAFYSQGIRITPTRVGVSRPG